MPQFTRKTQTSLTCSENSSIVQTDQDTYPASTFVHPVMLNVDELKSKVPS